MSLKPSKLRRQLRPIHVWAIALGCIVGLGSFVNPGKRFLPNSGVLGTAIAMVLGAMVMIIIAFNYAYMVPKYPKSGGEFTFTKACLGKFPAYICGWFLIAAYLSNVPMNSTAVPLIVDGLDGSMNILKWGFHYTIAGSKIYLGEILFVVFILIIFAFINMKGVKKAGVVQIILTLMLGLSVVALVIATIVSKEISLESIKPFWGFSKSEALIAYNSGEYTGIEAFSHHGIAGMTSAVLATFAIAPWAYVGFDTIPQVAEEFKFSYKKVSVIMIVAIVFGCFIYIANNTIAAIVLDNWPELILESETFPWLLLIAAEKLLGLPGKCLVGIAVSSAVLSGIMGFYLASSRLIYSMSRDGYLPRFFGTLDNQYGIPKNAIWFCLIVSLLGPFLGREALSWFVDMSAIGASIGYFFTCLSTLVTLKKDKDGTFFLKTMSILGILFSVAFVILQLIPIKGLSGVNFVKESYIMFYLWSGLGLLFYIIKEKYDIVIAENSETRK